MKPEDLFVGAWVNYSHTEDGIAPYDEYIRISADDISRDECIIEAHYKPIPITPEILEKNGFSRIDIEGNIKQSETGGFYVWYEIDSNILGIEEDTSTYEGESAKTLMKLRIFNVHELQAAMKLCGIKKEIIL